MAFRAISRLRPFFNPAPTYHATNFSPNRGFRALPPGRKLDSQRGVLEFLDADGGGVGAARNGRSWRTSELRLKSFDDLHKLWYVLLKEKNALLTEQAWCKTNQRHWTNGASNLYKVKRSMQRIRGVIGERTRAKRKVLALRTMEEEAKKGAEKKE